MREILVNKFDKLVGYDGHVGMTKEKIGLLQAAFLKRAFGTCDTSGFKKQSKSGKLSFCLCVVHEPSGALL